MMRVATLILALAVGSVVPAHSAQITPIQKVIGMLNDMYAKGEKEKNDEVVAFTAYQGFCKSQTKQKTEAIAKSKAEIEQLGADIDKAGADVLELSKAIQAHDAEIQAWETDKAEATKIREKAKADFEETNAEYEASISAVEKAMEKLKNGGAAAASLIELGSAPRVPQAARASFLSFLQMSSPETALMQDALEVEAPEAAAFESSSGGVVDMVTELGGKFDDEKAALVKKESEDAFAYQMLAQQLTDQIEGGKRMRESKASEKGAREKDKAEAEGDLADARASLQTDETFLADLTAECTQKNIDFEKRQELRAGELEAINKAIEIMSSDAVAGAGEKHLPDLLQQGATESFAQLRSGDRTPGLRAAAYLAEQARRTDSRVLSLLAVRVSTNPMKKVGKMIKDMIVKLTEEATEEAEHKGFCDTELGTNKITRDTKSQEVDTLTAEIEELNASINKLGQQITELSGAVAELDAAVAKATQDRAAEKAKNSETLEDAKVAKAATEQALTVLEEFYAKASKATSFSQVPGAPETFDKPYTGMAGGGVVGMLEVIVSDFARLIEETDMSETEAAAAFKQFKGDSEIDKATKAQDIKNKENSSTQKASQLNSAKEDLASTQGELDAAMQYFEKLKPSCIDAAMSYEDRVTAREEEIQSLKEALKILSE